MAVEGQKGSKPCYKPRPKRPSKLDPYKDYIMKRMADGVFNCVLLYKEIASEGFSGGMSILKDFVAPFRRQFKVQAVRRFETAAGEQMQADWGYLGTFELDGRMRKVWVFIIVLGYSRFLTACCTTSMDQESTILCHQYCFQQAGGVAQQIVYDNMKTVTTGRDMANRPIWQSRFLDFALFYGFQPVVCTPYKPRSKGKVEASVGYIKKNFCPGRQFTDLTDLNNQLQDWLNSVANVRIHATTGVRPVDRLAEEPLKPLPLSSFPTMVRFYRRVSSDGYLSYQGILYSVPWRFAGGQVEVEERAHGHLRIWWHGRLVAEHIMPRDGRRRVTESQHFAGLVSAQRKKRACGLSQCYPQVEERPLSVYESFAEAAR